MRLVEDMSGVLYLETGQTRPQTGQTRLIIYSFQGALQMGWTIVDTSPAEQALLRWHGFEPRPHANLV